jgi:hypothetical protein
LIPRGTQVHLAIERCFQIAGTNIWFGRCIFRRLVIFQRCYFIIVSAILVIAVNTNEISVLQVIELSRDRFAAWATALEAFMVIKNLVGEFLVGLAWREYVLALEALWCRLGVAGLTDKCAILFLKKLLSAD